MSDDLTGLNLVELLDRLEPVPQPEPISLWPQTSGWIWLGIIVLVLAVWLIRKALAAHRARAYRRAALAEVTQSGDDPVALAAILRRTALAAFPRRDVAGLYGDDWLTFLDRTYGGTDFTSGKGRVFAGLPYRAGEVPAGLADLVSDWIRKHDAARKDGA